MEVEGEAPAVVATEKKEEGMEGEPKKAEENQVPSSSVEVKD